MAKIKLGNNNRVVDTNSIKGGIKREDLKTDIQKKIFDALNVNADGQTDNVIDPKELNNAINYLLELSGNDLKLGKRDAKKFFKELNLEDLSQEDLFDFIEQLSTLNKDVVSSSVQKLDGETVILIVHENPKGDHQLLTTEEQINSNGESQINVTTTTDFDDNNKMTTSTSVMRNGDEITRSYTGADGNVVLDEAGNEVLQKETTVSDGTKTVIEYDNQGNKFYETVTYGDNALIAEEYEYIYKDGKQIRQLASKKQGDSTTYYTYDKAGHIIKEYTDGNNQQKETTYKYNDAGVLEQATTLNGGSLTRIVYSKDGTTLKHDLTGVTASYDDDGNATYSYNGTMTSTKYNAQNKAIAQKKVVGDKEYMIGYDGAGNTEGIIVQFGETTEAIANKFGCDINALIELNGGREAFGTGAKIKVPGELQADAEVLQGRGTSAQELQKQRNYQARVARQQQAQAECNARVIIDNYKIEDELVYVKNKGWQSIYTFDLNTASGIVNYLYIKEGQKEATSTSFNARLNQLKQENPGRFDSKGKLINPDQPLRLPVSPDLAQQWGAEVIRRNDVDTHADEYFKNKHGEALARTARNAICYTKAGGLVASTDVESLMGAVNALDSSNITGFLSAYQDKYGESFVKAIRGESAVEGKPFENEILTKVRNALKARAQELGLTESLTTGFNAINPSNDTEAIDNIINGIIRDIRSVEMQKASNRASFVAGLNNVSENSADQYLQLGQNNVDRANQIVDDQDANESAMEWLFDRALNWSDSSMSGTRNKISSFETKLNNIRQKCIGSDGKIDNNKFKQLYQETFGVPFSQKLINQYVDANEKLGCRLALEEFNNTFGNSSRRPASLSEADLRNYIYNSPLFNSSELRGQIAQMNKEQMLTLINDTGSRLNNLCTGIGTTNQIAKQIERIGSQAFGSDNDVVGDANHFVSVQRQGGMYTEVGIMIASMAAGPILGGTAKLASSVRFANIAKTLNTASRALSSTNYMRATAVVTTTMPLSTETISGVMRANAHEGEAVYQVNEHGEIVYDQNGNPVVDHYKTFGEAFDEGTNYSDATIRTAANVVTFGVGAKAAKSLYSAYESGLMSGKEAVGKLIGIDAAMGGATEFVTTGDISLEGFSMNLVMSALGHAYGLHSVRGSRGTQTHDNVNYDVTQYTNKEGFHEQLRDNQGNVVDIVRTSAGEEPTRMVIRGPEGDEIVIEFNKEVASAQVDTPVLDKAVHGTPVLARPSQTHVGQPKAQDIMNEVNQVIARPDVTPDELARVRRQLNGVSNRDVRNNMRRSLDERAQSLPEAERARYNEQVRADQRVAVQDIPNRRFISEEDGRALREYANGTDDVTELTALRDRIDPHQPGGQGARDILDARINELTKASRPASQINTEVHTALDEAIAGNKGLGSLTDLKTHITATTDPAELNALFDKWMQVRKNCGANRRQIDALFKEKGLDIQNPNKKLPIEPQPTDPAVVEPVETPLVHNEEVSVAIHEPEVVTPSQSGFLEQQFNTRLQESDIWQTAGNQQSVSRLGAEKVGRYSREFDELCRYATTPEQLDQLQILANKFRGQAENTNFNASIAKRRAELNGRSATEIRVNDHEILMDAPVVNNDGVPTPEFTPVKPVNEPTLTTSPTKVEYKPFDTKLHDSNIWRTAGNEHSVPRLGAEKVGRYTREFDELCRNAITLEQLDQLQMLANRFRGQAESISFNASIANRRAQLAGLAEAPTNAHLNYSDDVAFYDTLSPAEKAIVDNANIKHDDVIGIHGVLRKRLTEYDNGAILDLRYNRAVNGSLRSNDIPDNVLTPIINDYRSKMLKYPAGKKLVIITGRAGGGKSTIMKQMGLDETYFAPDADDIKPLLPGYADKGAGYVHSASVEINQGIITEAFNRGTNCVVQTTGWGDYVADVIEQAHNAGYTVELIHTNVTPENSIIRANSRGLETGRYVDPANIHQGTYVDEVVERFKDNPFIKSMTVYDNNGTAPVQIEKYLH